MRLDRLKALLKCILFFQSGPIKGKMIGLEKALIEIASFLNKRRTPYMVIGGLANIYWGEPRSTYDVDITISVPEKDIADTIRGLSKHFKLLTRSPWDLVPRTRLLTLATKSGYKVDLIFALLPYEEEAIKRAVRRKVGKHWVKVCAVEDLIIHKIISRRDKDIADVRQILANRKLKIDRHYLEPKLKALAVDLEKPEILEIYKERRKK